MEQMRRGKADTQTSDAKFDEQFKLGHRMQAKVMNRNGYMYHKSSWYQDCMNCSTARLNAGNGI